MILEKETALFDTGAIDTAITEAGQTASKYLSADSSGIMVYDGSNGEQKPSTVTSTTNNVFIDDNSVDVRKGTATLASFTGSGMSVNDSAGNEVASIGASTVLKNKYNNTTYTTTFEQGRIPRINSSSYDYGTRIDSSGAMILNAPSGMYINSDSAFSITRSGNDILEQFAGEIDNHTISAGASEVIRFDANVIDIPSPYRPICISGFNISNASSSGTRSSNIWVRGAYVDMTGIPTIKIVNSSSTANAKILIELSVLCTCLSYHA